MATTPSLDTLLQTLLDTLDPSLARWDSLEHRLAGMTPDDSPPAGDFAGLLQDIVAANGDDMTALLDIERQLQTTVADSFFPLPG